VSNWHMFFPGNYLIASYATVTDLAADIRGRTVNCQFVISALTGTRALDGWAPADVWDFVNNPRDSGRHPPIVPPPPIPTPPGLSNAFAALASPPSNQEQKPPQPPFNWFDK
jgi:hypothetical protein